jgi:hypothetical protein
MMTISGLSQVDSLARLAMDNAGSRANSDIAMVVLKQTMDQQKQQTAALLALIDQGTAGGSSPDGLGQIVDVRA